MDTINLTGLASSIAGKIAPMIREIIDQHEQNIHSIHIVGSAVMPDYNEKLSDINSIVVLHDMDLKFITFLAPLGKKYGKKRIAAPLVMTPEYIDKSIKAFPVEFLDFKLLHKTVYGEDILANVQIEKAPLRIQSEREIKIKLMGLRQGYLSSVGRKEVLAAIFVRSITGSVALFRTIIYLLGKEPPILRAEVVKMFADVTGIETDIFQKLLMLKAKAIKPSEQELMDLFNRYYNALESIEKTIDNLHV
jgi:predicted nucleotidyltransferase